MFFSVLNLILLSIFNQQKFVNIGYIIEFTQLFHNISKHFFIFYLLVFKKINIPYNHVLIVI